jgi:hypothetical protein
MSLKIPFSITTQTILLHHKLTPVSLAPCPAMFATDAVHNSPTPQHHQERGLIAEQDEGTGLRARVGDEVLTDLAN